MRSHDDESLLAWSFPDEGDSAFPLLSVEPVPGVSLTTRPMGDDCPLWLFADMPARFASCGDVVNDIFFNDREPSQLANGALRMDAFLIPLPGRRNEFLTPLNCGVWNRKASEQVPLALHLTLTNRQQNLYSRKGCVDLVRLEFSVIKVSLQSELGWTISEWGHTSLTPD